MTTQVNQLAALQARLDALEAENAKLKANVTAGGTGIKVSPKGAISVYGLGRWPVTLYKSQMTKFLGMVPNIEKFMAENDALLSEKENQASKAS